MRTQLHICIPKHVQILFQACFQPSTVRAYTPPSNAPMIREAAPYFLDVGGLHFSRPCLSDSCSATCRRPTNSALPQSYKVSLPFDRRHHYIQVLGIAFCGLDKIFQYFKPKHDLRYPWGSLKIVDHVHHLVPRAYKASCSSCRARALRSTLRLQGLPGLLQANTIQVRQMNFFADWFTLAPPEVVLSSLPAPSANTRCDVQDLTLPRRTPQLRFSVEKVGGEHA